MAHGNIAQMQQPLRDKASPKQHVAAPRRQHMGLHVLHQRPQAAQIFKADLLASVQRLWLEQSRQGAGQVTGILQSRTGRGAGCVDQLHKLSPGQEGVAFSQQGACYNVVLQGMQAVMIRCRN